MHGLLECLICALLIFWNCWSLLLTYYYERTLGDSRRYPKSFFFFTTFFQNARVVKIRDLIADIRDREIRDDFSLSFCCLHLPSKQSVDMGSLRGLSPFIIVLGWIYLRFIFAVYFCHFMWQVPIIESIEHIWWDEDIISLSISNNSWGHHCRSNHLCLNLSFLSFCLQ